MASQTGTDAATEARLLGNTLYQAGKLSEAEEAYKRAASLAPHDSSPVSNLSAVRYEMGDYRGAAAYIKDALALIVDETGDSGKKDKLYIRLAKCFLHLLEFTPAEEAISSIGNVDLRSELNESVESMKALRAEVSDESALRRQVLDQISRFKPCLQDVAEYYAVGHDHLETLTESWGMTGGTEAPDVSLFFAGSGDGRNIFSTITSMFLGEAKTRGVSFRQLHFTVLDLKPASLARLLIFLTMMDRVGVESSVPNSKPTDCLVAMAYLFSCQVIPPFAEAELQSTIEVLIKKLEGEDAGLQFVYVREQDRESIIRVLRQWQHPWDGITKIADVRKLVKQKRPGGAMHSVAALEHNRDPDHKAEQAYFEKFTTLLLPSGIMGRREPDFMAPLAEYQSTGKSKKLQQYIDSNWKINNTLIDYDFANRSREQGGRDQTQFDFHPLKVAESMGARAPTRNSSLEQLADMFKIFSVSTVSLGENKRLVVEVIVGEMTDIMERMHYNLLDYRLSPPTDGGALDPTTFPRTYDYMHLSNIPDYIGGLLTTFSVGRPLLKEDEPSSLRFNNLLNPPEFGNHETFQSEYLLMHDTELIRQHFLLSRRQGNTGNRDLPPMLAALGDSFMFEDYMVWDRVPKSTRSFQKLLPKSQFEKWVYAHLLKICLPYPRPMFSGAPVYAPLNLSALIRFISDLFEMGYPAHWLVGILSSICTGTVTTSARPPPDVVTKPADIDKRRPAKAISIQPWVAEFTTLLSIWRRLLPFGIDSLGGTLVPLDSIYEYSITFPPFPPEHERIPHFSLVFVNTAVGNTMRPESFYDYLSGTSSVSDISLRDKATVCVTAFQYTTASRTAVFWMRSDKMKQMAAGQWTAFICRTDEWEAITDGVDVSFEVRTGRKWTALL